MPTYHSSRSTQAFLAIALTAGTLLSSLQPVEATPLLTGISAATNVSPSYILGPGDQIDIRVFGYEEFNGPKVVLPDGTISLPPLLNSLPVAGRTADQLAQELGNRLQTYLVDPQVTVTLTTLRPIVITVSGEVLRPGPLQIRGLTAVNGNGNGNNNDNNTTPNVSAALSLAGGITQNADVRQVLIRRFNPSGNGETVTVNLWDAISSENIPPNLLLQDGDSVFVPRLAAGETIDRRLVARSSYAPQTVRVRVVGEVTRPGEVQVPPNSSLSSAVAIAGGPTREARLRKVVFVRMGENGQIQQQQIDLRNLTDNFQIQDGDVIIVPRDSGDGVLETAGRLIGPLGFLLNLLGF